MSKFAATTKVPVDQSRGEIDKTLQRYGATKVAYMSEDSRAIVMFEAKERRIRFDLPLLAKKAGENDATRKTREQDTRRRWRALLLCIKSKLESVESGIETFEEAFMSHVVMPDGQTVGAHLTPAIAAAYKDQVMVPLLPPPSKTK